MDHGIQSDMLIAEQQNVVQQIIIGNDVWSAAGAKILRGSVLHNHAVVGANAVVKEEISENAVSVGVPAKVIKYRN